MAGVLDSVTEMAVNGYADILAHHTKQLCDDVFNLKNITEENTHLTDMWMQEVSNRGLLTLVIVVSAFV